MRKSSLTTAGNVGVGVGTEGFRVSGSKYAETLSPAERGARIEALLDLLGPTDVFDLFYRRTDVALRALTRVLPSRERGELLVNAVSWIPLVPYPSLLRTLRCGADRIGHPGCIGADGVVPGESRLAISMYVLLSPDRKCTKS